MLLVETAPDPAIAPRPDRVLAPADLRRLSERSDAEGLIRFGVHLLLIAGPLAWVPRRRSHLRGPPGHLWGKKRAGLPGAWGERTGARSRGRRERESNTEPGCRFHLLRRSQLKRSARVNSQPTVTL